MTAGTRSIYRTNPALADIKRHAGLEGEIKSVIQIENVQDADDGHRINVPAGVVWALTERWINTDRTVGAVIKVLGSDRFLTHVNLHAAARGYMWSQLYVTDFGPDTCNECGQLADEEEWVQDFYAPEWARRYGVLA